MNYFELIIEFFELRDKSIFFLSWELQIKKMLSLRSPALALSCNVPWRSFFMSLFVFFYLYFSLFSVNLHIFQLILN